MENLFARGVPGGFFFAGTDRSQGAVRCAYKKTDVHSYVWHGERPSGNSMTLRVLMLATLGYTAFR